MGEMAGAVALVIGAIAAAVFLVLAVATFLRWQRHPEAWLEDRLHPVRHSFVATLPIGMILLATVGVALGAPHAWVRPLWWAGSLVQLFVTWWVLSRWWRGNVVGGLVLAAVNPAPAANRPAASG